jgi:hypothetical protein
MKKMYSMPERYVNFIKEKAKELEIAESDLLRRIIEVYMEQLKKK